MPTVNLNAARKELLFVCDPVELRKKFPHDDVDGLLAAVRDGASLLEVTGPVEQAAAAVHAAVAGKPGVVLLGGYDIVPSQQIYCLPKGSTADPATDSDQFVVWSDDIYGDVDRDGLPELPVSRVPDADSFEFLVTLMNAPDLAPRPPYGLINRLRPFANKVFHAIKDASETKLQPSLPVNLQAAGNPQPEFGESNVGYFMLHGVLEDGTLYRGQRDAHTRVEALRIDHAKQLKSGGFVFTGCCWAGLIVDVDEDSGVARPRDKTRSLALAMLAQGAVAFIGSTGVHYSPTPEGPHPHPDPDASDDYLCKPLHMAFWERCAQGLAPARALLEAKLDYFEGIPYAGAPIDPDLQIALEVKNCLEMTCLGLGW